MPFVFLAFSAFSGPVQSNDYYKLSGQEKADLSRYLGWVWGDGKPGNDGTGILYKGGNPNYADTVARLAAISFDGINNPLGFPESGNRLLNHAWNYWDNSLPGGNPGDPEILREAIRHPNFLAGILEGEGQIFHSDPGADFYVADQSYAPSHPDRIYDIANFGPERMIQFYLLLEETYGFRNTAVSIGNRKYGSETHHCEVFELLRQEYEQRRIQNESGNLQSGFTVKIHVQPPYFDAIRNYGYFEKNGGNYRTPAPDSGLRIIRSSLSGQNAEASGPMTFFENDGIAGTRLRHSSGNYLNSDLTVGFSGNSSDQLWRVINVSNGYNRIISQNSSLIKNVLRGYEDGALTLTSESNTWHQTQWEFIPVANVSNQYYLRNRFSGLYLRVTSAGTVEHGVPGTAARWTLEGVAAATCS